MLYINKLHPFFRKIAMENIVKEKERKGEKIPSENEMEQMDLAIAFDWVEAGQWELWSAFNLLANHDKFSSFQDDLMLLIYKFESGNTQYIQTLEKLTNELLIVLHKVKNEGFTEELTQEYELLTNMFNAINGINEKING